MISLKKLAADGLIKLTDARRKYTIDGVQRLEAIYRIPLKYLYYNNQNGRISTALQKYVSGHPEVVLNPALDDENPEYNDLFESFIFKSNEQRMKATQESISDRGQEEPGVVLDDGRVIDGNRRFTALRRIQKSKGIEQYFEAAILDFGITNSVDKKTIKQLELDLQMGKEDRQDYDPIDRIFDVYNTVYVEKIMTPQEYAKSIGKERARGINNDIKEAKLISSYLEFIGAPRDAYYIAKELRLDGPMNEVRRVLDKNKLLDDGEVKSAVFALLSMHYSGTDANEGGDITRLIRKELQSMVSKKDDWVCLTEDNVDTIYDAFQDTPVSDASQISQILNSSEGIKAASNDFMRSSRRLGKMNEYRGELQKVVETVSACVESLESIDTATLESLTVEQSKDVAADLEKIGMIVRKDYDVLSQTGNLL